MLNKIKWFIHDLLEKYLDNAKWGTETYSFRKKLYLKIFKMDKEICHFCLVRSKDYYCNECAAETL